MSHQTRLLPRIFRAILATSISGPAAEPSGEQLLRASTRRTIRSGLHAVDTLGSRGAEIQAAVNALAAELRNSSALVRVHVLADLMGQIGPPAAPAAKAIMALLVDPNVHVHRAAVQAVARFIPDPAAAIPQLLNVLQDLDPAVKMGDTDALAELGKPAVPSLIQALGRGESTAYWACLAAEGEIGPDAAAAVPALQEARAKWQRVLAISDSRPTNSARRRLINQRNKWRESCSRRALQRYNRKQRPAVTRWPEVTTHVQKFQVVPNQCLLAPGVVCHGRQFGIKGLQPG